MRFRETVRAALDGRRRSQPAYSLRRFARVLGVHHTTTSRLLKGEGPVAERSLRRVGARLGFDGRELARMCAVEREEAILEAVGRRAFRPDSRWLASASGIAIDQVNITLQALLRTGRLRMVSARVWKRGRQEA